MRGSAKRQEGLFTVVSLVLVLICAAAFADPATYSWRYYRPGNTGIQGDFNEALWIAPDGDPYISGYDGDFEEGGFAKFIQAENRWVNYSNVDYPVIGHPNDTGIVRVTDIVPDATGKLWMGTWRGAMRFDPAVGPDSITRFGPSNSQLIDETVFDIDVAPDGTIWFANNGAVRYDPATDTWTQWVTGNVFTSVQPKPGGGYLVWSSERPPFQNYTFIFDSDTQLWTTIDVVYPNGNPGDVAGMPGKDCVDDAGNFWALRLTNPGDFDTLDYRQPDGTWISPPEPYDGITFSISAFKAYGNGHALMADGNGEVWQFNGTSWSSLGIWRPGANTHALDIDAAGNVWVSGVGGAAKRDVTTGAWQRYRITNTANFDMFNRDLTIDPINGYMYAGANAGPGIGGMVRFDGTRWTGFDQLTYGLGYDWPFGTDYCQALAYRPSNGAVAVNPYWGYGIHEWNGSTFDTLDLAGNAKRMCEDSLGRLWAIGEYFSLGYYDGSTFISVPITAWGEGITKDPTMPGTIWARTGYEIVRTDGAYRFSRTIADFPELTDNTDQFIGVAPEANGFAWVGATAIYDGDGEEGALFHIDTNTGTYQVFRSALGWPFPGTLAIPWAVTPDGRLWMIYDTYYPYTERGLLWYDGINIGTFPAPPDGGPQWGGLPHGQVEDLEVRVIPNGYELWMSCVSRGIAVLKVLTDCSTIALSPSSLPDGVINSAYSQTITASGGTEPYSFAVTIGTLPAGLTLSTSGDLTGTPMAAGTFDFIVTATDSTGCTGLQSYSITIGCTTITISPGSLPDGAVSTPYSQTLTASGGAAPYSFAVTSGALPAGLTLSTSGDLTGTPIAAGTFNFSVTATDSAGCTGLQSYSITINCGTITISPGSLPDGNVLTPYSQTLTASGGIAPYNFAIASGSLPDGLTLDSSTGVISGTPTVAATFDFQVTLTDANSCTGSANYSITVTSGCLFCDDFEDGSLDGNWTYLKPGWAESGGALQGTPTSKKAIAVATPVFAGCSLCTAETTMRTSGGPQNKLSMYVWYADKKNNFELIMKEGSDKWLLRQRSGGAVVGKVKVSVPIDANVDYDIIVGYDGANVTVLVDGVQVISYLPAASVPIGTIGYTAKGTTGSFNFIRVN